MLRQAARCTGCGGGDDKARQLGGGLIGWMPFLIDRLESV